MILLPSLRTVVILTPRTGSGSLKRAVLARWPDAILLYRHMEADGVPQGYDRWPKVGVVRQPVDRLWSLYKFLQNFDGDHAPAYIDAMRACVSMPFCDWVVNNETVFTSPYDRSGAGKFYPHYTVRHPLPENHKSQFDYLRPDLGTRVVRFDQLAILEAELDITLGAFNVTASRSPPALTPAARDHIERVMRWDLAQFAPAKVLAHA